MKKLFLIITAVLFLFAASGCGKQPAAPDRSKPAGVIVVNGNPDFGEALQVYADADNDRYTFPLDAALVYYFDYDEENIYAGDQNILSLIFGADADTHSVGTQAKAGYAVKAGAENRFIVYDLYFNGEQLYFNTGMRLAALEMGEGTACTAKSDSSSFSITVESAVPAAFFTIACRKGEEELAFGTIRPEEMEDYMKYPLPEGTDNVEINTFDAGSQHIGRRTLTPGEYKYTVAYDVGGQFLGARTMVLVWPETAEE